MKLYPYTDVHTFHRDTIDALVQKEVENNLPIGILDRGIRGEAHDDWFMARVEDSLGNNCLIALMTPPNNIILVCPSDDLPLDALRLLAEDLLRSGVNPPGVIAEKELSHAFAQAYTQMRGVNYRVKTNERVFRLDAVQDVPLIGALRLAEKRDLFYIPYWMRDFRENCFGVLEPLNVEQTRAAIEKKYLYVLEVEGQPVSLAGTSRQMPHGRSVGPVYTPPHFRSLGYATACVAMLSRLILGWGNEYCVLFTNIANPTSNSVYAKIGYRPLRDYAEIAFI